MNALLLIRSGTVACMAMFQCVLLFGQVPPVVEWQRLLGGTEPDFANSIGQTTDGGYIVVGGTSSSNGDVVGYQGGIRDAWVVKLDANGAIEWQRPFGGPGMDHAAAVEQTNDGGYIVAGAADADGGDVSGNSFQPQGPLRETAADRGPAPPLDHVAPLWDARCSS